MGMTASGAKDRSNASSGLITSNDYYLSHGMGNLLLGAVYYKEAELLYSRLPSEVIEAVLPFIPLIRDIKWSGNLMLAEEHFGTTGMAPADPKNKVTSGKWITQQQDRLKSGKLPEDKQILLKKTLPWWSQSRSEIEFEFRFNTLVNYHREHGSYPSKGFKDASGFDIGLWLMSLRANNKNGKLSKHRLEALDASLPDWSTITESKRGETWKAHFDSAVAHFMTTGQYPSTNSGDRAEVKLAAWLLYMRRKHQNGVLSKQRITLLDERLPLWRGINDAQWEECLQRAAQTRNESVSSTYYSNDYASNEWMGHQRRASKNGKMWEFRREMLEAKIPDWEGMSLRDSQWEENLQRAADFWRDHNTFPFISKDPEAASASIVQWLSIQRERHHKGILLPEREERLDQILPQWRAGYVRKAQWETTLSDAVDFFATHGFLPRQDVTHLSPEQNERSHNLAKWLECQRKAMWGKTLRDERRAILDIELPHWGCGKPEEDFRYKLKSFVEYVKSEGRRPPYDSPLCMWFKNQRKMHNKGKMSQHKIDAFEAEYPSWKEDVHR